MDTLQSSFEQYQAVDDEIASIHRLASVSLEDPGVREDLCRRVAAIDRQLGMEEIRDIKKSLQGAMDSVKESLQSTWNNMKKVTEEVSVALDGTETKHLEVAERLLANARGDLPSSATLNDRKIADMLHVNGRVPNDPKAFMPSLIALVKKVRTQVIPEMHKPLVETGTFLMQTKPFHNPMEYHEVVERVLGEAVDFQDLLQRFKIDELKQQWPGGLCLVRPADKPINVDYANRIADERAQQVLRKVQAFNKAEIKLIKDPASKHPEAISSVVPLLNSQSAANALKLCKELVDEGKFLAGYRPNDGGGLYPSQTIGWALGEVTKYAQPVGIDAGDRAAAHLCADYFESTLCQYHLLHPAVCRLAFDTANAVIRWVEESIKQYK